MQTYTIKEASKLCGLPESTLRYYESRGLIDFVGRNASSRHRVYTEQDIDIISAIACLNSTGISIEKMREYLAAFEKNESGHETQLRILKEQEEALIQEEKIIALRRKYIQSKISYYFALNNNDMEEFEKIKEGLEKLSKKLRFGSKK